MPRCPPPNAAQLQVLLPRSPTCPVVVQEPHPNTGLPGRCIFSEASSAQAQPPPSNPLAPIPPSASTLNLLERPTPSGLPHPTIVERVTSHAAPYSAPPVRHNCARDRTDIPCHPAALPSVARASNRPDTRPGRTPWPSPGASGRTLPGLASAAVPGAL